ncbi:hypothetical protein Tco_0661351 [Tanacetum coccineum]
MGNRNRTRNSPDMLLGIILQFKFLSKSVLTRTKRWHESRLRRDKNFKVGDKVLLFNSRFKMHPGKLKSRWYPNVVKAVYPYETVEITDKNRINFKVNGQRLNKYHDGHIHVEDKEVVEFEEDTTRKMLKEKV